MNAATPLASLLFALQLLAGLFFSAVPLGLVTITALNLAAAFLPFDLHLPRESLFAADIHKVSVAEIATGSLSLCIALAFFAYLGPHTLIRCKRRLGAWRYVTSGKPLAAVEGPPIFNEGSELPYLGIQLGKFYFDLTTDCRLSAADLRQLTAVYRAGGVMRIWYLPMGVRVWKNPATGEETMQGALPIRGEWHP